MLCAQGVGKWDAALCATAEAAVLSQKIADCATVSWLECSFVRRVAKNSSAFKERTHNCFIIEKIIWPTIIKLGHVLK